MNVALHLFIPPVGKFYAGGVYDTMPLMSELPMFVSPKRFDNKFIIYGDDIITIKGAMLAVGGASKVGEFGDCAARIWR